MGVGLLGVEGPGLRERVPGLDQDQFAKLAADAEQACPVSNVLRGNAEITLKATLS